MCASVDRTRFAHASWANVLGNIAKILVEGLVGIAFGSVALIADAAHSIGDLVASIVVLIWGDTRFEAPDADHPHGHARIEPLSALFVGGVIVILGGVLLYESLQGLVVGTSVVFHPLLVVAIGFAMVDMWLVYWYTTRVNADLGSTALRALAVDCLNDLYTSGAALVGIIGVFLGYPILDPLAGALVSGLVIYQGVIIGRENLGYLSGRAAPESIQTEIRTSLLTHPQVNGVHDLAVFYDGTVLEVEAHVEIDGDTTLREAHAIETQLMEQVKATENVSDVHLHLDPSGIGEWKDTPEETES